MRQYRGPRLGLKDPTSPEFGLLAKTDPEAFFIRSGAQKYIESVRVLDDGILNIEATMQRAGIRLIQNKEETPDNRDPSYANGTIYGLGSLQIGEPLCIYIDPTLESAERRLTCGHELGHYFLNRFTDFRSSDRSSNGRGFVEPFCEMFGREMVLGQSMDIDFTESKEQTICQIMERYQVGHMTAIYYLVTNQVLPRIFTMDVGIGEAPNPYYSGKVDRRIVCIECELGIPHDLNDAGELPNFDFTAHDWAGETPYTDCGVVKRDELARQLKFRTLNKKYGRWTNDDDARMPEEIARSSELWGAVREGMGKRAVSEILGSYEDDVPF